MSKKPKRTAGILVEDSSDITIRGNVIRGFDDAVHVTNSENVNIDNVEHHVSAEENERRSKHEADVRPDESSSERVVRKTGKTKIYLPPRRKP